MGLVETLSRRARKLGVSHRIIQLLPLVSIILYVSGIVWMMVLPMESRYRETYVSENALLPHHATTYFRESEWHITRGIRNEINSLPFDTPNMRIMGVKNLLERVGLKTDVHHWNIDNDASERFNNSQTEGRNLYGILHAPRGSHNEAIVVVAPFMTADGLYNDGGVALIVSLANYLKRWSLWQKNLIFVIPSDSNIALRKWVEAYHTSLKHTAGSIEGALVLDFSQVGETFDHIEISYDGLNGQQANLDLLNVLVRVADGESVLSEIFGMGHNYSQYIIRLKCMLKGLYSQLFTGLDIGTGADMFSGYRIDAISIKAKGEGRHDITTFGRIVESTIRSINNLLEHFHQSFFIYLLMGPRQFVSIATFLPAAILIATSYAIKGMHYFFEIPSSSLSTYHVQTATSLGMVILLSLALAWVLPLLQLNVYSSVGLFGACASQIFLIRDVIPRESKDFVHSITLILFSIGLTVIAMLDFTLSLAVGIAGLPLAWVSGTGRFRHLLVIIGCPVLLLGVIAQVRGESAEIFRKKLVFSMTELGVWAFPAVLYLWVPLWLSAFLCCTSTTQPTKLKFKAE